MQPQFQRDEWHTDDGRRPSRPSVEKRSRVDRCAHRAELWLAPFALRALVVVLVFLMFCGSLFQEVGPVEKLPPVEELFSASGQGGSANVAGRSQATPPTVAAAVESAGVPHETPLTKACLYLHIAQKFVWVVGDLPRLCTETSTEATLAPNLAQVQLHTSSQSFLTHCRAAHRFLQQTDAKTLSVPWLCDAGDDEEGSIEMRYNTLTLFADELLRPAEQLANACEQTSAIPWRRLFELQELADVAARWEEALRLAEVAEAGDAVATNSPAELSADRRESMPAKRPSRDRLAWHGPRDLSRDLAFEQFLPDGPLQVRVDYVRVTSGLNSRRRGNT